MVFGFQIRMLVSSPPDATRLSDLFQHEQIREPLALNKPWSLPYMFHTLDMLSYALVSNRSPWLLHWIDDIK
jgi:hypothetical protein